MARILIIGSLAAELGMAARIADGPRGAAVGRRGRRRRGSRGCAATGADLVLCDVMHDVGWLIGQLVAERIACPVDRLRPADDADAAVRAIQAGAKEFLPLPPDPDLIAAMLAGGRRRPGEAGGPRPGDGRAAGARRAGRRAPKRRC